MKRLFVSINLPLPIAQLLVALDPELEGVRWLNGGQMHLTLSFLGNVALEAEQKLKGNLPAISWKTFFLPLAGLESFRGRAHRRLWIGVGAGHPHLFQLRKRVQEAALQSGIEPDLQSFHPHITLARCRDVSEQSIRPFLKTHVQFDAGMIHVESFCLNSSRLTQNGSIYICELVCQSNDR